MRAHGQIDSIVYTVLKVMPCKPKPPSDLYLAGPLLRRCYARRLSELPLAKGSFVVAAEPNHAEDTGAALNFDPHRSTLRPLRTPP